MATETELKLSARPEDLPAVERVLEAMTQPAARGGAHLASTYYDTPERSLIRHGIVLRVRESAGGFVQTVKSAPNGAGNGLARGEWEDAIGGPAPDPTAPQSGRLFATMPADGLAPLFRTEVDRRTFDLAPGPATRIEAAIDTGALVGAPSDRTEPISEVELELKEGKPAALYDVALHLLETAPLRLALDSKAERGYRLVEGGRHPPEVVRAPPIALDPTLSGNEALQRIGRACLDHLMRNEPAALAGEPDGIHQMRVAVRRLRAILSAFGKFLPVEQRRWASQQLRWLADALGDARNLDAFRSTVLGAAPKKLAAAGRLADLAQGVEQRRRLAYERATEAIQSRRYTGALLRILQWFDAMAWRSGDGPDPLAQPIAHIAPRVLDHRKRAVKKRSKRFARQSPAQRHELRIALKKLRYATELLGGLYPPETTAAFVGRLKRLQDDLGAANDVRVGHDIVADLTVSSAVDSVGGDLLAWHEARLTKREPELREHLRRLKSEQRFWRDRPANE